MILLIACDSLLPFLRRALPLINSGLTPQDTNMANSNSSQPNLVCDYMSMNNSLIKNHVGVKNHAGVY